MSVSQTSTVGIGVIGCGARIRGVLSMIPGIKERFHVVAVCDPSSVSVRKIRDSLNPSAKVYKDFRLLVKDPSVDWVYIGSWNCFHRVHAEAAMRAGKAVFCEKPLATTMEDVIALKKIHDQTRRPFCVGFTLRYSPHYRKIHEVISEGKMGDILSMEFNETLHFDHGGYIHGDWRRFRKWAGTHLLEKCCHDVDQVLWMTGSYPVRVASFGGCNFFVPRNKKFIGEVGKNPAGRRPFGWDGPHDLNPFTASKDIVDHQVAILEFANGIKATFHTNCSTNLPERRMYICGSRGTLRADLITGILELSLIKYGTKLQKIDTRSRDGHGGGDQVLGRELADAMFQGKPMSSSLEDGLKSAMTCFGIDQALDQGRVIDLRSMWKKIGLFS